MPKITERFDAPVLALFHAGETLDDADRAALLDAGDAVLDDLTAILEERALWDEAAPGRGWAPIHAASLLAEIGDPSALAPLYRVLRAVDDDAVLDDAVSDAIVAFGQRAIAPGRAELKSWDDVFLVDLAHVFARLDVHDRAALQVLLKFFLKDPEFGAPLLAQYGDPAGRDAIQVVLERYLVAASLDPLHADTILSLADAYQALGGELRGDHRKAVAGLRDARQRAEELAERRRRRADPSRGADTVVHPPRPGRNEPCWCGSHKKYKRCHWAEDHR